MTDRYPFIVDDGGAVAAGYTPDARDCVPRAIAIAARLPYKVVLTELLRRRNVKRQTARSRPHPHPRAGVHRDVYEPYLFDLGFTWQPTMQIGSGCTVHLRPSELADLIGDGPAVVSVSRHLTAVDCGIRDTDDPSRDGSRCVYGVYTPTIDTVERLCHVCGTMPDDDEPHFRIFCVLDHAMLSLSSPHTPTQIADRATRNGYPTTPQFVEHCLTEFAARPPSRSHLVGRIVTDRRHCAVVRLDCYFVGGGPNAGRWSVSAAGRSVWRAAVPRSGKWREARLMPNRTYSTGGYHVEFAGQIVGRVFKSAVNHDRGPAGRRYVTSRTVSDRWFYSSADGSGSGGVWYDTRLDAVANLVRDWLNRHG